MKLNLSTVSVLQGLFWLVTGVWPFVHLPSFLWVTGPKEDIWLLYTVAVLIIVIGTILTTAGFRKTVTAEIKWLGILGAAGLLGIDLRYALADVIWDVYLLDAVAEFVLILLWLTAGKRPENIDWERVEQHERTGKQAQDKELPKDKGAGRGGGAGYQ